MENCWPFHQEELGKPYFLMSITQWFGMVGEDLPRLHLKPKWWVSNFKSIYQQYLMNEYRIGVIEHRILSMIFLANLILLYWNLYIHFQSVQEACSFFKYCKYTRTISGKPNQLLNVKCYLIVHADLNHCLCIVVTFQSRAFKGNEYY